LSKSLKDLLEAHAASDAEVSFDEFCRSAILAYSHEVIFWHNVRGRLKHTYSSFEKFTGYLQFAFDKSSERPISIKEHLTEEEIAFVIQSIIRANPIRNTGEKVRRPLLNFSAPFVPPVSRTVKPKPPIGG
jgi:hypothetical protein